MSGNNRLAILSTLLWAIILGIIFFARYPAEDLIAHSVQATMQARSEISPTLTPTLSLEETRINSTDESTATISEATAAPAESSAPCLYAQMVAETIPDGSAINRGGTFTKTWVIENTGSCSWTSAYRVVFTGGEQMGAPDSIKIGQDVAPGERLTITLNLTAPSFNGSARGNWTLSTEQGVRFGEIWVEIDVAS
jgi:hypothetical protein